MKITKELIEKVAQIARLELSDKEIEKFKKEFPEILNLFSEIEKTKTTNKETKPSLINQSRKDIEEKCFSLSETFANTKNSERNFFKGPVIK